MRKTKNLRRVPQGQVRIADQRSGGGSFCLSRSSGGAVGVGSGGFCLVESLEHGTGQLRATEHEAARNLGLWDVEVQSEDLYGVLFDLGKRTAPCVDG